MKARITAGLCASMLFSASAIADDALREQAQRLFEPIPTAEVVVEQKGLTPEQIELGKWLFFEPRLSASHIITCNTCHSVGTGGADNIPASIGHGWQAGPRNSPTVLNAVFNAAQFWDGRASDLAEQAKGPIQASVEMNATPEHVEDTLNSIPQYVELFEKAFPGDKPAVTFDNVAAAIEAFESTLVTPNSRFDQWLAGEDSMDELEIDGLRLFINKGCVACHAGINFGQGYFPSASSRKPGADVLPEDDKGRFTVTETATDEYVFRARRCVTLLLTAPYFHSGEVWDLRRRCHYGQQPVGTRAE